MIYKKYLMWKLLIKIGKFESKDKVSKNNFINYYKTKYKHEGIIIKISDYYDNSICENIFDKIKECIDVLDENIRRYLKEHNFKINIVSSRYLNIYILKHLYNIEYNNLIDDNLLTKDHINLSREGLYIWGRKEIFVVCKNLDEFHMEETIFHEIGHFLDYDYHYDISYDTIVNLKKSESNNENFRFRRCDNEEFKEIFELEKEKSKLKKYYKKTFKEYFAETFSIYYMRKLYSKYKKCKKYNKYRIAQSIKYISDFIQNFKV